MDIQNIINQTDKREKGYLIQKYFNNKNDMVKLMKEMAVSLEETITLTVEKDGEISLSWGDKNHLILYK